MASFHAMEFKEYRMDRAPDQGCTKICKEYEQDLTRHMHTYDFPGLDLGLAINNVKQISK